jgi:hypothetical protein
MTGALIRSGHAACCIGTAWWAIALRSSEMDLLPNLFGNPRKGERDLTAVYPTFRMYGPSRVCKDLVQKQRQVSCSHVSDLFLRAMPSGPDGDPHILPKFDTL